MALPRVESSAVSARLGAVAIALLFLALAMSAAAQTRERMWTVTCGLPLADNPILALLSKDVPLAPSAARSGHFEAKMLNRPHPDGGLSTELWMLSQSIGWWMVKAIRVHPDDQSKLSENSFGTQTGIRQIIDSPFLSRPAVVRAGHPEDEAVVNGQITALMPTASQLRCAPQSD